MTLFLLVIGLAASLVLLTQHASAGPRDVAAPKASFAHREDIKTFIAEMAAEPGFDGPRLYRLFAQVRHQPEVIAAMSRPLLAPLKWHEYAPRFLSPRRIRDGVVYWQKHEGSLKKAEEQFGVAAEVIVAIIGIESYYGRNEGSYRVLDALTTLAFDYPRRAEFFRNELKQFLFITRDSGLSPLQVKGSFAGAMGVPQFMPGSFRNYAVDFNQDGVIDIWNDHEDPIGSVANYLARHDWRPGAPAWQDVAIDPAVRETILRKLDGGISERRTLAAWASDGVAASSPLRCGDEPVALLMLEELNNSRFLLACQNFYVLTRYNRSRLYASAVWELAQALRAARS